MRYLIIPLLLLSSLLFSLNAEERIGLDPLLRGVWMLHVISDDGGKTLEAVNPAEELAVASATRILFVGGVERRVQRVIIINDDEGNPGNFVMLDNGLLLGITKRPDQEFILVQVFEEGKEITRWVITVHD